MVWGRLEVYLMAKKKKKADAPAEAKAEGKKSMDKSEGFAQLMKNMQDSAKQSRVFLASNTTKQWRYIDFCDPNTGLPNLALEYLFGSRGLITGRIVKYEGESHVGKTSMVLLHYGMAQKDRDGVYACHFETESAPLPQDFLHVLGCDPHELLVEQPGSLGNCLDRIEYVIKQLRTDIDPEKKYPVLFGIDSISALGEIGGDPDGYDKKVEEKEKKKVKGGGVGYHSRLFSKFFRNQSAFLDWNDAAIIMTAQSRADISMDGNPFASKQSKTTHLAAAPTGFHSTWSVEVDGKNWWDDDTKSVIGEVITLTCRKNKVGPKNRRVEVHLRQEASPGNPAGWDFTMAQLDVMRRFDVFAKDFSNAGGYYKHPRVNGGKAIRTDVKAFVEAVLKETDFVMEIREAMNVRGFGFAFESKYGDEGRQRIYTPDEIAELEKELEVTDASNS
jgi:RecA/RadA recombinase